VLDGSKNNLSWLNDNPSGKNAVANSCLWFTFPLSQAPTRINRLSLSLF
jgi:hypothetical protein